MHAERAKGALKRALPNLAPLSDERVPLFAYGEIEAATSVVS